MTSTTRNNILVILGSLALFIVASEAAIHYINLSHEPFALTEGIKGQIYILAGVILDIAISLARAYLNRKTDTTIKALSNDIRNGAIADHIVSQIKDKSNDIPNA